MRTFDCPKCPLCSAQGVPRYRDLRDRLFSAPGEWSLSQCPNESCGILWLNPMPVEDDLGEAYKSYFTHGYRAAHILSRKRRAFLRVAYGYFQSAEHPITLKERFNSAQFRMRFRRRSELEGLIFHLPRQNGAKLLDVGCGSGDSMALMSMLGWTVEGVEFDPAAVETARAKGLKVHQGSLAEQKFPAGSFDAVGLSHVIEHVANPVDVIAECRRVLAPDGVLVLITPNICSLGHRLYGADWVALDPPRHLHIFTPTALIQAVRSAGFGTVEYTTTMRAADFNAATSADIRRTKRARTGAFGWGQLRIARLFQAIELAALQFNDEIGEEIVLRARR